MKRGDDVFLFTLVDFLLQILFFGLLLYVVSRSLAPPSLSADESKAKTQLLKEAKISNLVELTDILTKMGPLDQLPGTAEFLQKSGGVSAVKATVDTMQQVGGAEKVKYLQADIKVKEQELEGLRTEMKAWGTPSCLYDTVAGKVRPRNLAKVRVFDDRVELESPSTDMRDLLSSMNLEFDSVKRLNHASFRKTFAPLIVQKPSCRYFLEVVSRPSLYSSMQVVWSAFRTQ